MMYTDNAQNISFDTHCEHLAQLLPKIIADDELHAKWLNSLSMMESVGARKIAAYVDPKQVDELTLQHAAEEARHAHYLKRQINKLGKQLSRYTDESLLAARPSYRYLHQLDWACSRHFKAQGKTGRALKDHCYLMVTYLIEVRAMKLYHTYQDALTTAESTIHVRSIIKEEEGHLTHMMHQLANTVDNWQAQCAKLQATEQTLFDRWLHQLNAVIRSH